LNRKYVIPVVACVLVLSMLFSISTPVLAQASRPVIGPTLEVTTIPEDDQKREKGIIILGLTPDPDMGVWPKDIDTNELPPDQVAADYLSQHKLLVTYNGRALLWRQSGAADSKEIDEPVVSCNVLEKDKANPVDDKWGEPTEQFPAENLVTTLIDVSTEFECKPRWKEPAGYPGYYESVGVLDVYFVLPEDADPANWIADHILVVTVTLVVGRAIILGSDIQDICVLGWAMDTNTKYITKPDGGDDYHFTWPDPLGPFVSCEEAATWQRYYLGLEDGGIGAIVQEV